MAKCILALNQSWWFTAYCLNTAWNCSRKSCRAICLCLRARSSGPLVTLMLFLISSGSLRSVLRRSRSGWSRGIGRSSCPRAPFPGQRTSVPQGTRKGDCDALDSVLTSGIVVKDAAAINQGAHKFYLPRSCSSSSVGFIYPHIAAQLNSHVRRMHPAVAWDIFPTGNVLDFG
jgi:hypothetical protein